MLKLLEVLGFVVPSCFYIVLFFLSSKDGFLSTLFFYMFVIPIWIITKVLHNNMGQIDHCVFAGFVVYMMYNITSDNKLLKYFCLAFATIAVIESIFQTYLLNLK